MTTPTEIEALVELLQRPYGKLTGGERQDVATALTALQAENDKLGAAIIRQSGAAKTLRAAIVSEVQHLKDMDRSEYNAAKSLDSEREANAILTEQLAAAVARAEAAEGALLHEVKRSRRHLAQSTLDICAALDQIKEINNA
jgi:septal ring factor EnvC (AmiA/AmiB activator)